MEITVKLPDDLAQHPNPGREALEALVIEGYRPGALSHYQASQFLGLSRFQFDGFLKQRDIYEHAYSVEDLNHDEETQRTVSLGLGLAPQNRLPPEFVLFLGSERTNRSKRSLSPGERRRRAVT
jgi:predicted HTH domain antitoxin